ncbi:hypothetical protein IZU99_09985 [Oscillospiraceae bacterium CM]|nr:hypothetical protein IZU99_09985 [Oscillospiraceae bacterium CM]
MDNSMNIGIGFAAGRKNFRHIARTYAESWCESGLTESENIKLNLFVAYDLKYKNTKPEDYRIHDPRITDMLNYPYYIGDTEIKKETAMLVSSGVVSRYEAQLLFGDGYAKKRNAILYFAVKNGMDYLLFIDDDEYPIAAAKTPDGLVWQGQQVLAAHLKAIENADITYGYHCGYVSPIPQITFNDVLTEDDFRMFIETISNDIISWNSIKEKMQNGGITYAKKSLLSSREAVEVPEINGAKFISGSNLFFKLNTEKQLFPFFNPPGARGEDTFLSTCLSDVKVLKVPCYMFHDGFLSYPHLLCGILPKKLKPIFSGNRETDERFYKACVGWIRYKPLLMYITGRDTYERDIALMKKNLDRVLPKVSRYFPTCDFMSLRQELDDFSSHVVEHYNMFEATKKAWERVMEFLNGQLNFYQGSVSAE